MKKPRKRGAMTLHKFVMREAAACGRMKPRPVFNATLAWKGRKLMCNGVCVAFITQGFNCWTSSIHCGAYGTLEAARRAVNRRFKITEVK